MDKKKIQKCLGIIICVGILLLFLSAIGLIKIAVLLSYGLAAWLAVVLAKKAYGDGRGSGPPKHPLATIFMITIGPVFLFAGVAFFWKFIAEYIQ